MGTEIGSVWVPAFAGMTIGGVWVKHGALIQFAGM